MTDLKLHRGGDDGLEPELRNGLRAIFAPPGGDMYWDELEARILARVTDVDLGWWAELDRWARPALLAAAALLVAAGIAMFHARQTETQLAYESILEPAPVPVETAVRPTLESEREATLRDVLGSYGRR